MKSFQSEKRISVMMLVTSFQPLPMGGSEKQAFALAKELNNRGFVISILALGRKQDLANETVDGIEIHRFKSPLYKRLIPITKNFYSNPVRFDYGKDDKANALVTGKKTLLSFIPYTMFLIQVYFYIRKEKSRPDFIYVPIMEWTAFIGTLLGKLLGAKTIVKDSTMNGIINLLRYPFGGQIQKYIAKHAYFVAMTSAIKSNYIKGGVSRSRIFDIPNGVQLPSLEQSYHPTRGRYVFIGNLYQQPAKGIDILIKAWKKVVAVLPESVLHVIGDGAIEQYIQYSEKVGIDRNIKFLGKQFQLEKYIRESTALILPSRREGMSNALLEAMSYGVPCIATDISGNQDLIKDKINGILVPVENEDAIVDAVILLNNNPELALNMGMRARETIANGYTMNLIGERYQELIFMLYCTIKILNHV